LIEKATLEQQYNAELVKYKAEFERKIQNDIDTLEMEKAEKLTKIKELDEAIQAFAANIGYNGPANIENLQSVYENRVREATDALNKKVTSEYNSPVNINFE